MRYSGMNVLLVGEDFQPAAQSLRDPLHRWGFRCHLAGTRRATLEFLKSRGSDLGAQPDASSRRKRFQLAFDFDGVAGHRVPLRAGGGQLPLATSHRRRAKLLGRGDVAARRFRASTRGTRPARTCWNAGEPVGRARPRCVAFTCEDDITSIIASASVALADASVDAS
jgi:hypothetical protein